ncbi:YhzD family protein [Evansella sp. AB-P1]|uniref:YhzD family protein n=1 Tax=Evansella sp. AB-P1 TaxID=3037653 RepID=UPI00241EA9AF|nr:YhzD family protein [Evansella sp. AB-P1]MDG5786392.1 YhzD family protein [Evansella sp. AB-P1]
MGKYYLTAFDRQGTLVLNEVLDAADDIQAQNLGLRRLSEKRLLQNPSRIVHSSGGLLYFHQ